MASIRDFVREAASFPIYIVNQQTALQHVGRSRHFAALKLQKYFRGYKVRQEITRWHRAATVLQKYIRRWLVIWHLPNIYQDYHDWYSSWYYNKMATRVQALWRGYWVRKDRIPPREVLKRRLEIAALNGKTQESMQDSFSKAQKEKMKEMDKEAEKWVLFILFKLHHHLRTYASEGIYSMHNSTQLSPIEELFKVLPLSEYMNEVKKRYYKELATKKPPPAFAFKEYVMRNLEEAYRNKDHSNDTKTVIPKLQVERKPFVLTKRLSKKPYEKGLFGAEQYSRAEFSLRVPDKSKNICGKDFDLHVRKKMVVEEDPPPYYLDHWVQVCDQHNIPD